MIEMAIFYNLDQESLLAKWDDFKSMSHLEGITDKFLSLLYYVKL